MLHWHPPLWCINNYTAKWIHNKSWWLWWWISLSIGVQIMLNHCQLAFYHKIDNDQNLLGTPLAAPRESTTFWPLWWWLSLLIRVQTILNHCHFVFLPLNQPSIKTFFQCMNIACHIEVSWVVCTLLDNGKLANQIMSLSIVIKYMGDYWGLLITKGFLRN